MNIWKLNVVLVVRVDELKNLNALLQSKLLDLRKYRWNMSWKLPMFDVLGETLAELASGIRKQYVERIPQLVFQTTYTLNNGDSKTMKHAPDSSRGETQAALWRGRISRPYRA